ncbi:hypothetical protein TKK_0016510 [Trichogramma kaykai]
MLNIGSFIAVSTFNDGKSALLKIMQELDIHPGSNAIKYSEQIDEKRIDQAEVQKTMSSKETRSVNLKRKHNYPDDDSYVPGGH